jgi:hypothetical protein
MLKFKKTNQLNFYVISLTDSNQKIIIFFIFLTKPVYHRTVPGITLVEHVSQFKKPWYSLCDDNSLSGFVFNFKQIFFLLKGRACLLKAEYI